MQKEDLLKRLRVWAAVITSAFAVVIVALVFQFAITLNNNRLKSELAAKIDAAHKATEAAKQDKEYYENGYVKDYLRDEHGKQ